VRAISPASIDRTGLEVDDLNALNALKARSAFNSAPLRSLEFRRFWRGIPLTFPGARALSGVAAQRSGIGGWGRPLGGAFASNCWRCLTLNSRTTGSSLGKSSTSSSTSATTTTKAKRVAERIRSHLVGREGAIGDDLRESHGPCMAAVGLPPTHCRPRASNAIAEQPEDAGGSAITEWWPNRRDGGV